MGKCSLSSTVDASISKHAEHVLARNAAKQFLNDLTEEAVEELQQDVKENRVSTQEEPAPAPAPPPPPAPAPTPPAIQEAATQVVSLPPMIEQTVSIQQQSESPSAECLTAAEFIASQPNLSIFSRLTGIAGLKATLNDPSTLFMVIAPTNDAFQSFFTGLSITEDDIVEDTLLLNKIVRYHIIADRAIPQSEWTDGTALPTLDGDELLTIDVPLGEDPSLEGASGYPLATVFGQEELTCQALVFPVTSVLVSPDVDELLSS